MAVLTLALGIGVSTALFSVIDAALLRPLPYPHPERLVTLDIEEEHGPGKFSRYAPSISDIRAWRTLTPILSHAGTGRVSGFVPLIVETGQPQRLTVAEASEDFLETYGIVPILGRSIQSDDTREGAPRIALLGLTPIGSASSAPTRRSGRRLRVQNHPVTIVGVLPAGFYSDTAVWQARQYGGSWLDSRGSGSPVIARLRPGVSLAQAAAALGVLTPRSTMHGPAPAAVRVAIASMYDEETGPTAPRSGRCRWRSR